MPCQRAALYHVRANATASHEARDCFFDFGRKLFDSNADSVLFAVSCVPLKKCSFRRNCCHSMQLHVPGCDARAAQALRELGPLRAGAASLPPGIHHLSDNPLQN